MNGRLTKTHLERHYRRTGVFIVRHDHGLVLSEAILPRYTVYLPDGEFPARNLLQAEDAILKYLLRTEGGSNETDEQLAR